MISSMLPKTLDRPLRGGQKSRGLIRIALQGAQAGVHLLDPDEGLLALLLVCSSRHGLRPPAAQAEIRRCRRQRPRRGFWPTLGGGLKRASVLGRAWPAIRPKWRHLGRTRATRRSESTDRSVKRILGTPCRKGADGATQNRLATTLRTYYDIGGRSFNYGFQNERMLLVRNSRAARSSGASLKCGRGQLTGGEMSASPRTAKSSSACR